MSAYICNPEHIGVLAAWAALKNCAVWKGKDKVETARNVAQSLAEENIRSVTYRYPDDKDGNRPGPCLKDADIIKAAQIYAVHFLHNNPRLTLPHVFNLIACLEYQSCETENWMNSLAKRQIDLISAKAASLLPGYDDFDWEYTTLMLPEVEALYGAGSE